MNCWKLELLVISMILFATTTTVTTISTTPQQKVNTQPTMPPIPITYEQEVTSSNSKIPFETFIQQIFIPVENKQKEVEPVE